MNDYVTKPIDPDQLWAVLVRWMPSREAGAAEKVNVPTGLTFLPNAIEGLDVEQALRQLQGKEKLYRAVLQSFCKTQANAMRQLAEALEAGDLTQAIRCAHTLKGVAGTVGAWRLKPLAENIERALNQGESVSLLRADIDAATHELARLVEAVRVQLQ